MSFSYQIISYMEKNLALADDEQQMDYIALMLKHVPAEKHVTVMQECATYLCLRASQRRMEMMSWADSIAAEDDVKDARYVSMTLVEWEIAKGNARDCRLFPSWSAWQEWANRVNIKRRPAPRIVIPREPDPVTELLAERMDIMRYPQRYVTNDVEKVALVREFEALIVRRGGKDRLDKVIESEWENSSDAQTT